jgi:crotonobetainyl-CoA:carnitine CoA-transferase CaiB-like acyl-CoA transferase
MSEQPLAGLRVLESGGFIAAYAGHLLAEAGADVIRITPPGGDPLAAEPPFLAGGRSIQEAWYNLGKRIATGIGAAELAGADILIDEPWADLPLTVAEVANPALVHVVVTPRGEDQPPIAANDLIYNALSGGASVTGTPETPPLTGYGNQAYHTVGMYVAICALASLRAARATGQSQRVDLSAQEALASCTEQVMMQWLFNAPQWPRIAQRMGSLHWSRAYEVVPDRNGDAFMFSVAMRFLDTILPWMAEDGMAGDLTDRERYPDAIAIAKNMDHVMALTKAWLGAGDREELFREAQARHLPWGPSVSVADAATSPQVEGRGYLQSRDVPGEGSIAIPGRLFRASSDGPPPPVSTNVQVSEIGWDARTAATSEGKTSDPSRPLEGIRIFDFTHVLAGPFGTRVLGDLGADVIKIGTSMRSGGAGGPVHPYYASWNRNKKSIMLNLGDPRGIEVARKIAGVSDAIVENFSAGVLRRWGLDRPSLAEVNPKITVVSMGGMGQDGPWKSFVTFAPTIHALTGITHLTNPPGERFMGYGFSLTDHLSGLAGAIAILEGVELARRTGQGLEVDLSQYEVGLNLMAPALIDYKANGIDPEPVGNRHPFGAWSPHGVYRCAGDDRWVAIAVRGDEQWRALCRVMGRDELADDARFATHAARLSNEDALDAAVEDWTRGQDRYEVMARCQAEGIAAAAVQDAGDLGETDTAIRDRGFFSHSTPSGGSNGNAIDVFPARFNGVRPAIYNAVHQLGVDTFDFLSGPVGIPEDEVAELAAEGILS